MHSLAIDVLLGIVIFACWLGVLGMLRMRRPVQALHYLTLPATIGVIALTIAVVVESGASPVSFKTALIAIILLAINSVVTHATARAFRTREVGHWEPCAGDSIESVASKHHPQEEQRS